jgi:3-oxoadipate enol-lactonase
VSGCPSNSDGHPGRRANETRVAEREGLVDVDRGCLRYQISGEGEAIVFLHGMGLDARMWDAEAVRFVRDHTVVRYDLRGFGKSTMPRASFAHHADLRALLAYLSIDRAHVVGLSMGGGVAIDFALVYPEIVRSLVLVDTFVGGFKFQENAAQMSAASAAAKTGGAAAGRAAWLANPLFAPARRSREVDERLRAMVEDYSGWHWLNDSPRVPLNPPAWERLSEIASRTLVVVGELDFVEFRVIAERLASDLPAATRKVIAGVGHMANMEAPKKFQDIVATFLSG